MSEQDNRNNGSLMPAGSRGLVPVANANPLVSRGLVDLRAQPNEVELRLPGLIGLFERPSSFLRPANGWFEGWVRIAAPPFDEVAAGTPIRVWIKPDYIYRVELSITIDDEVLALLPGIDESIPLWSLEIRKSRYVTLRGFAHLSDLSHLCELDFTCSHCLTDEGLDFVRKLPNLQFLNLDCCHVGSEIGLAHIGSLRLLRELDLTNHLKRAIARLRFLSGLPYLERLKLNQRPITDQDLQYITNLRSLQYLDLQGCNQITNIAKQALITALPECAIRFG